MIKAVLFEAYRGIKGPARIDFGNVTLLCGPNSAGKSSLLRVLDLFKKLSSGKHQPIDSEGSPIRVLESGEIYADKIIIGIEFTTESLIKNKKRESEYRDRYIAAGWDHADLWDMFAGKVIKIVVKCGGNDPEDLFELFIDNKLVLQIDNNTTFFNHFFKKDEVDEVFMENDRALFGNVKIHDSLISTYLTVFEESTFDADPITRSALEKLFREKKDLWTTIRGLGFYYLSDELNFDHNLLSPNISITDLFNDDDDLIRWAVECSAESNIDESISEENYLQWLNDNDVIDIKNKIEEIFNGLWDDADKLKCFLEGLFIRLEAALEFQHVSGSRGIVFSDQPYHVDHYGGKAGELEYGNQDKHISRYLSSWWYRQKNLFTNKDSENQMHHDVVQLGFSKLMPALGGYSFEPQVYELNDITSQINPSIKLNPSGFSAQRISSGVLVYPYVALISSPSHLLNFRDVGSGLSFMLPIFSCLDTSNLSIIEQPELHLHPRAQCELADVFIYASSFNHKSVVETHSEHLILRLSRRIRETTKGILLKNELKLKASDVSIHYFKPDGKGKTTIHKIRFDSHGDFLDLWPDGFFAERNSELFDE